MTNKTPMLIPLLLANTGRFVLADELRFNLILLVTFLIEIVLFSSNTSVIDNK